MRLFLRVISGNKVPYLFTLLFLALGWAITHTVQRIDDSPTVTFEIEGQKPARKLRQQQAILRLGKMMLSNVGIDIYCEIKFVKYKDRDD